MAHIYVYKKNVDPEYIHDLTENLTGVPAKNQQVSFLIELLLNRSFNVDYFPILTRM